MGRVLVTGASGIVGRHLVRALAAAGVPQHAAVRNPSVRFPDGVDRFLVGELGEDTEWGAALAGCDTVIHIAGQLPGADVTDAEFDLRNNIATRHLVAQALRSNVSRLIFISSVTAVSGAASLEVLTDSCEPRPAGAYGRSKLAAEEHVATFARAGRSGISLRAPVIYSSRSVGKWRMLMRLAASGMPLPLRGVHNRRSMLALENLIDALLHLVALPAAPESSGRYLVADAHPVSTASAVSLLRRGMGLPSRLFWMPKTGLDYALRLMRQRNAAESLFGDLEIDISRFCRTFAWEPVVAPENAICAVGAAYMRERQAERRSAAGRKS